MTSATQPISTQTSTSDTVFEKLLCDIVSGKHAPNSRLPAERELAKELGASRPTLREALRRLGEWNLVVAKRGSGIVVKPMSDWMLDVLPAFMRYSKPDEHTPSVLDILEDLMILRRSLMKEILGIIAGRFPPEMTVNAREAANHAWELRHESAKFATADLDVLRIMTQSAKFLPGLWLLNQLRSIYVDMTRTIGAMLPPPDDTYLGVWNEVLDACQVQDGERAVASMNSYLVRHDDRLLSLLGRKP